MATKVQTNFSEICKHVLNRGVPFFYSKHIGLLKPPRTKCHN